MRREICTIAASGLLSTVSIASTMPIPVTDPAYTSCSTTFSKQYAAELAVISNVLIKDPSDPQRFSKLLDKSKPSEKLKEAFLSVKQADRCSIEWVTRISGSEPRAAAVWREGQAEADILAAELLEGKLTLGDYNKRALALQTSLLRKTLEASSSVGGSVSSRTAQTQAPVAPKPQLRAVESIAANAPPTAPIASRSSTRSFAGASMFVSVDHKATTAKTTYTQGSSRYTFDGLGRQSIVSAIGGDYTFQLSEKHLLSVGLKYDLMDEKLAHLTASGTVANGDITLKQKNHYSIFVAPGYQTSPDTLLYGKLSYETAKADLSGTVDRSQSDLKFGSVIYHGIGYGLGLKTYLTDDIYAGVELHRVMYDSKGLSSTSTSTGTTTGSAYLGYKF